VVTRDGSPLAEVYVNQLKVLDAIPAAARTDEQGNFEIVLQPGKHTLVFSTNIPGYQLPSTRAARYSRTAGDANSPHVNVEVSAGTPIALEPLVVDRSHAVQVAVVFPDGLPASGVSVILRDEDARIGLPARMAVELPKVFKDISEAVDQGYFNFDNLPPSQDYALYTQLDQTVAGVLPVSLIEIPAAGQLAELGEVATQPAQLLRVSIRTIDKSSLPAGGRLFVSRGKAWHSPRFDLPDDGQSQTEVVLPSVSNEMLEISVRIPGYRVFRTVPSLQRDWNHRYPLRFEGTMDLIVVLAPDK
jgi:hypothetical protein